MICVGEPFLYKRASYKMFDHQRRPSWLISWCSPMLAHLPRDPCRLGLKSLLQRMPRVAGPPHSWDPALYRYALSNLLGSRPGADQLLKVMESQTYMPRKLSNAEDLCSNTTTDARFSNEMFWVLWIVRKNNGPVWTRKTDMRVCSPTYLG